MAINLDRNLLDELGLGSLPENEKTSLLNHIYETLEMRVGMRLADQMTNDQLDEFEKYFEAKDDAGAFNWLETNFPNYKQIVQDEFNKLKEEIRKSAPQIIQAASQNNNQEQPVDSSLSPGVGPQTPPMPPSNNSVPPPTQPFISNTPQNNDNPQEPPVVPPSNPPYQPPSAS